MERSIDLGTRKLGFSSWLEIRFPGKTNGKMEILRLASYESLEIYGK